ncbi:hypothetical protein TNCT_649891 [Trichonephila clavata]|uniref:DUF4371 domain-containing protein n=1 Tax=Trichonephila clavata TaxID=2740835 RepID=A0A8X6G5H2_TRICU|nr:hypothetical protein TNCT_649891 [Trichonephila clavata]
MLPTQHELNTIKLYAAAIYHPYLKMSVTTLNSVIYICDLLHDLASYLLKNISLYTNTVGGRVKDISENMSDTNQLLEFFSLTLDESTNVSDTA